MFKIDVYCPFKHGWISAESDECSGKPIFVSCNMLEYGSNGLKCMKEMITGNEIQVYSYEHETNWNGVSVKKVRQSQNNVKVMFTVSLPSRA